MTKHTTIQVQLYDHIRGGLSAADHQAVSAHLRTCTSCAAEADELRSLIASQKGSRPDPASELPQEFWNTLLNEVDARIASQVRPVPWYRRLAGWLRPGPTPQYRVAVTFAAILIVAGSTLITWTVLQRTPERMAPAMADAVVLDSSATVQPTRLQKYLHRSRTLFVGVANMNVPEDQPPDLQTERRISRELVTEARALRQEALDVNSARLINDLEKIQIELANMAPDDAAPGVDMIRQGIESKNLLFKLRIAEMLYQQVKYAE
jgi:anti-sigma factor RsiW